MSANTSCPECAAACVLTHPSGNPSKTCPTCKGEGHVDPRDALVASPHFEYALGLITDDGAVIVDMLPGWLVTIIKINGERSTGWRALAGQRIDVDNPANHGHLLALVRKAWGHGPARDVNIVRLDDGRHCLSVLVLDAGGFWRFDDDVHDVWDGWHRTRPTIVDLARDTYELALVAALLAAPAPA